MILYYIGHLAAKAYVQKPTGLNQQSRRVRMLLPYSINTWKLACLLFLYVYL